MLERPGDCSDARGIVWCLSAQHLSGRSLGAEPCDVSASGPHFVPGSIHHDDRPGSASCRLTHLVPVFLHTHVITGVLERFTGLLDGHATTKVGVSGS